MKKPITTIQDALILQLENLVYAEKKVREEFRICSNNVSSPRLKAEIYKYIDSSRSKLIKLERIFNYLMQEPVNRKNEVINKLIEETHEMLACNRSSHLKDILMVSCIQNISAYKISCYKMAYTFAAELELDTATDLLQQILELEIETGKSLSIISVEEFNKIQHAVNLV